jgi:dienelactone hydrolase
MDLLQLDESTPRVQHYTLVYPVLRYPLPGHRVVEQLADDGRVEPKLALSGETAELYARYIWNSQEGPRPPDGPAEPRIWQHGSREYDLDYTHDNTDLRGFVVEPGGGELRGTVLIVHQWRGLGGEEKERARMLAKLGYRAFAIDMYGANVRAKNNDEAAELAGTYYGDRQLMRGRVQAAIDALKSEGKLTDNLAAIGYCFGGTVVLECARHGFDFDAVVSFHGGLKFESAPRQGQVKASVLVCNGYADPYVSIEDRQEFKREMQQAQADFVFIDYADAVHSFTSRAAGPMEEGKGAAYNEKADRRSWEAMKAFFEGAMNPA